MSAVQANRRQGLLLAMPWVFVLIWSTGFIVARYGMPHSPPLTFLSMRYALSLVCFGIWIAMAGAKWPRNGTQWLHLSVVGVLLHAGYLGGVWSAVKAGIGAGTVSLIVGLQPVLTALWLTLSAGPAAAPGTSAGVPVSAMAPAPGSARVSTRQWIGLALGSLGLTLVVWHKLGGGEVTPWNLALAVFALVSITTGTLYQKRFVAACDVRTANAVQLLAALAVSLPLALLETEPVVWHPEMIGAVAWSVLALTLGGSSLLYLLIQRGAATQVTSLMYLVPPCTATLAWLLFDEVFTASMAIGMALTVTGVALVVRTPATR